MVTGILWKKLKEISKKVRRDTCTDIFVTFSGNLKNNVKRIFGENFNNIF